MSKAQIKKQLNLKVGEPAEIDLSGNMTTGFSWFLEIKPNELLLSSAVYTTNPHPPGSVGVPGKTVYSFLAHEPCDRKELRFIYMRPWESKPVQTVSYEVNILIE